MSEPKPLASLSPTLLARKGTAKPAMRPQVHYPDSLARTFVEDDLGWNDMGEEHEATPSILSSITFPASPTAAGEVVPIKAKVELPLGPMKPVVVHQQEDMARTVAPIEAEAQVEPVPAEPPSLQTASAPAVKSALRRRSALDRGARAAFTLRMDAERHLKLRLACTIRNRSAQQLMTEALDKLIDELPDLSTLAAQVAERR